MYEHPADEIVFGKTGYSCKDSIIYRKHSPLSYPLTNMENRMVHFLSQRPNAFMDFKDWITYAYYPYPYTEASFRVVLCKLRKKLVSIGGFDIHLSKNDLVLLHTFEDGGMGALDIVNSIGAEDAVYFQHIGIHRRWQVLFDIEKGLCMFLTASEVELFMYCMERFEMPLPRSEVAQVMFSNGDKLSNLGAMMCKLNAKLFDFGYIISSPQKFFVSLRNTDENYIPHERKSIFA